MKVWTPSAQYDAIIGCVVKEDVDIWILGLLAGPLSRASEENFDHAVTNNCTVEVRGVQNNLQEQLSILESHSNVLKFSRKLESHEWKVENCSTCPLTKSSSQGTMSKWRLEPNRVP